MSATVAVLGPGAVGGLLAVRLADAGVDVVCVARPDTAAAIESRGLTLRHGSEETTVRPRAVEQLEERPELLLVAVKAPALDHALERVGPGAETVVPLLNGIEHMEVIRKRVAGTVVAGSCARLEAFRDGSTTIVQSTPSVVLRLASQAPDETVELLRKAAEVRVGGSEDDVLWEKLARMAVFAAATSLTQRPVGELRSDPEWRARLRQCIEETCAVARVDGVELRPEAQWEIIDAMPPGLTTSTARDVAAGRPSELDALTGAAVRAGERLGVPTPALAGLLAETEERCQALSL